MTKRLLVLEDGTVFEGKAFGADIDVTGEIVFNTGMTGYQESITDQSYNGQILTFTYPWWGIMELIVMITNPSYQLVRELSFSKKRVELATGAN